MAHKTRTIAIVTVAAGVGVAAALVAMPAQAVAPAYGPEPTPTATATPTPPPPPPTPTPTPTPTTPPTPPANGVFNPPNPPAPKRVSKNVLVVARGQAVQAMPRLYAHPASTKLSSAPQADRRVGKKKYVPIYRVGQIVRLVARVPAGQAFTMSIKDGSTWRTMGVGTSDAGGRLSMVAFRGAKAQEYAYKFVSKTTGKTFYVKVNLRGARTAR